MGYEGQSLCANCNADLHPFEIHVCDSCAIELLERAATERVRSESNG
ncbi:protein NinF [Pectobacterium odoriferum]